jgi:hypothetical protein
MLMPHGKSMEKTSCAAQDQRAAMGLWADASGSYSDTACGDGSRPAVPGPSKPELTEGFIYFREGEGPHLKAVSKVFPAGLDGHEMGMALLEALMAGPPATDLAPVFPAGTRVNVLFITPGGDAYVDLALSQGKLARTDTITELLGVYSLVNSLTLNVPGISRVKLLVNGVENSSLGGHVSLAPFFETNMLIVK